MSDLRAGVGAEPRFVWRAGAAFWCGVLISLFCVGAGAAHIGRTNVYLPEPYVLRTLNARIDS